LRQLGAGEARHGLVGKDEIELGLSSADELERLDAVLGLGDGVAE
jgi:hypothetical protein